MKLTFFVQPLYGHLSDHLRDLLGQTKINHTIFLPNTTAIHQSIDSGTLGFSVPKTQTLFIVNGLFLPSAPQTVQTIQNYSLYVYPPYLSSGLTHAKWTSVTRCRNGMIYTIDQFLLPSLSPLDTISILNETEQMEELLKSLNLSDIISGELKTILIPNNQALAQLLPFGTLLHDLEYLVLDGLYMSHQLMNTTIQTAFGPLYFSYHHVTNQRQTARLVRTDILTTTGVIHIIDHVLTANKTQMISSANHLYSRHFLFYCSLFFLGINI